MSSYTLYDYTETLRAVGVASTDVARVVRAWGRNGDYCEWEGGFVLAMKDGRFAYAWGWCDTTGWGCQDGGQVEFFDKDPGAKQLRDVPMHMGGYIEALSGEAKPDEPWDEEPADLNRWHADGCPENREW